MNFGTAVVNKGLTKPNPYEKTVYLLFNSILIMPCEHE